MSHLETILMVRLGAMGDILHALPAATSLKASFPQKKLMWVTQRRWMPLLSGNPHLDRVVPFDKGSGRELMQSIGRLRSIRPELAFDFQGLMQSAAVGWLARPKEYWGFAHPMVRERGAPWFYTDAALPKGTHRIERNLELIRLAGAETVSEATWIPRGVAEGLLPESPFVLANPFAGWGAKQWPLASFAELGMQLRAEGMELVLNVSPTQARVLGAVPNVTIQSSSLAGLIYTTRQAVAVVGVDSGPLHLAAALKKPGVGIYGPTDPATHGPFGGTMQVLRSSAAATTYARRDEIEQSMKDIKPGAVLQALRVSLAESLAKAERLS